MYSKSVLYNLFLLIACLISFTTVFGCSSINTASNAPIFKWKYQTDYHIISSPAVDVSGNIYFGSQDKHVYALSPNGELIWKKKLGNKVNSSPTIFETRLYVGSQDTYLYALDIETGNIIKKYKTNNSVHNSVAIDSFGALYFGSYDGYFYALNPNFTLRWKYQTGNVIDSSPAIDREGYIYIASSNGNVYSFTSDSNEPRWIFNAGDTVTVSPAIGKGNTLYIGALNGNFYAIDTLTGTEKWKYEIDDSILSSAAIAPNRSILFGSLNNNIYALSEKGELIWKKKLEGQITSSPAISRENHVFVGSYDNNIYMLRIDDGSIIWTYEAQDYIIASPSLSQDGSLYISSMDYSLYAFKTSSKGYALSAWPGLGAGGAHVGFEKKHLDNTRPTFLIAQTDTADSLSSSETSETQDDSSTVVSHSRSKVISGINTEAQSFIYALDYQNTQLELFTLNSANGTVISNKIIQPSLGSIVNTSFNDICTLRVNNRNVFLGLSEANNSIFISNIDETGNLLQESLIEDTSLYEFNDPIDMAEITIDDKTFIYVLGHKDHGLSVFQVLDDKNKPLHNILNLDNVENHNYALDSPNQIIIAELYNTPFLFISSAVESGVSIFKIENNGMITLTDSIFDIEHTNYHIKDIDSMALLSGNDAIYLVTASDSENAISTFSISNEGILDFSSSVAFEETDFIQQLGYISSIYINDRYYLVAYEQSQLNSSIFTLNKNNNVTQFLNDENFETALENTSSVAYIPTDDNTFLVFAKDNQMELDFYKIVP